MVAIQLDKERHLRLTARGMVAFEEKTGKSLLRGVDLGTMTAGELVALAWACLIHEDKELTYDAVLDMVEIGDMPMLAKAVSECVVESFPEKEEGTGAPLAERSQSGSTSGPSGGTTSP